MVREHSCELTIDREYDPRRCRLLFNGETTVLHCHHYTTLTTQLAEDSKLFDGKALLRKAAEHTFYKILADLFKPVACRSDRLALASDYWRFAGMGTVVFEKVGPFASNARMDHSHVDEGWIKKWGPRETPVNHIGQGYLSAVLAAAYDLPPGSFEVVENESIVAGAAASRFTIIRK